MTELDLWLLLIIIELPFEYGYTFVKRWPAKHAAAAAAAAAAATASATATATASAAVAAAATVVSCFVIAIGGGGSGGGRARGEGGDIDAHIMQGRFRLGGSHVVGTAGRVAH